MKIKEPVPEINNQETKVTEGYWWGEKIIKCYRKISQN